MYEHGMVVMQDYERAVKLAVDFGYADFQKNLACLELICTKLKG